MKKNDGFTLLEVILAMVIFLIGMLGTVAVLQMATKASVKSREQMTASRVLDLAFSKVLTIDYFALFACNSSQNVFGLTGTFDGSATYPYLGVLTDVQLAVVSAGYTHYTVDIIFMRRDTGDSNGNGFTSDLIPFTDSNNDTYDDFDPSIRNFDQNSDGDKNDTYMLGGRRISEQPDTHLKEVNIKLWKNSEMIAEQVRLVSMEQLSGLESPASGAALRINMSSPESSSFLYDLTTTPRLNAFNLSILKSYPADVMAYRADSTSPILLEGTAEPSSVVKFYVGGTINQIDTANASTVGAFSKNSALVNTNLVVGSNKIYAKATKDTNFSPFALRDVIKDIDPPQISSNTPTGTIYTRSPSVNAFINDVYPSSFTAVSGICGEVISLIVNGSSVTHTYDPSTGKVAWVDPVNFGPIVTSSFTSTYTVKLEGGDKAHYKTALTWAFTVDISTYDATSPVIANKLPAELPSTVPTAYPVISALLTDAQSGIDPYSIVLTLDSVVVVDASNIGDYYDPATGILSYEVVNELSNGSAHTVNLTVNHWTTDPPGNITTTVSWSFTVSY